MAQAPRPINRSRGNLPPPDDIAQLLRSIEGSDSDSPDVAEEIEIRDAQPVMRASEREWGHDEYVPQVTDAEIEEHHREHHPELYQRQAARRQAEEERDRAAEALRSRQRESERTQDIGRIQRASTNRQEQAARVIAELTQTIELPIIHPGDGSRFEGL